MSVSASQPAAARPRDALLFLVSPGAGPGRALRRLRRLLDRAGSDGGAVEAVPVRAPDEAAEVLERAGPERVPVAVGGDGTVGMVAAAVHRLGRGAAPMGILPLGTANIVARSLGLDTPLAGLRALEEGRVAALDAVETGRDRTPLSLTAVCVGFEARFVGVYMGARRFGRPVAALAGVSQLLRRCPGVTLELDGETVVEPGRTVFGVGLYNTRVYMPGVVMAPDADHADGVAECLVYENAAAYVGTFARGARGGSTAPRRGVERRRWREARIESPHPLQVDGEVLAAGELVARVVHEGLRVFAPGPSRT